MQRLCLSGQASMLLLALTAGLPVFTTTLPSSKVSEIPTAVVRTQAGLEHWRHAWTEEARLDGGTLSRGGMPSGGTSGRIEHFAGTSAASPQTAARSTRSGAARRRGKGTNNPVVHFTRTCINATAKTAGRKKGRHARDQRNPAPPSHSGSSS